MHFIKGEVNNRSEKSEENQKKIRARVGIDSTGAKEKGEERSQESGVRSRERKRKSTRIILRKKRDREKGRERLEKERHGTGLMKV
jgi:hypothetical protein